MQITLIICLICILNAFVVKIECIYGGQDVKKGNFAYQALIRDKTSNSKPCGGVILGPRLILTTAVCADSHKNVVIVVGTVYRNQGGTEFNVENTILHHFVQEPYPFKNGGKFSNNIALLRTSTAIEFTEFIQPATLPTEKSSDWEATTVSGWGELLSDHQPNILQYLETHTIDFWECRSSIQDKYNLSSDKHLCTHNESSGLCGMGDEGSPLIDYNHNLIGLASFVVDVKKCDKERPEVYIQVHPFMEWIFRTMNEGIKSFGQVSHNTNIILTLIIFEIFVVVMNLN